MVREYEGQHQSEIKKIATLFAIMDLVKDKPRSIADISRSLQINRSTLRYYLNDLKSENKIKIKRELNQPGRPTYIEIDEDHFEEEEEIRQQKVKEYKAKMKKDPFTIAITNILRENSKITMDNLFNEVKKLNLDQSYISKTMIALNYLKLEKRVVEEIRLI